MSVCGSERGTLYDSHREVQVINLGCSGMRQQLELLLAGALDTMKQHSLRAASSTSTISDDDIIV